MDELAQPLASRRAQLDARIRAEAARHLPDWRQISRLRSQRDLLTEQMRAIRHPL